MKNTKRIIAVLLALVLLLSCSITAVYAESSNVKVNVGSKAVKFEGDLGTPFINNDNRTLVPFRAVANFMPGVVVDWDNESREALFGRAEVPVTINGHNVTMNYCVRFPIDTNQVWESYNLYDENGDIITSWDRLSTMNTKAIIRGGRTYAPIRFLAESFLYTVGWDDSTRTVLLMPSPEKTWGQDKIDKELNGVYPVTSRATATLYAKEFARKFLTKKDTPVQFVSQEENYLEGEEDTTGWRFSFPEYNGDEIYINDMGEIWYWDSEDEMFNLWY